MLSKVHGQFLVASLIVCVWSADSVAQCWQVEVTDCSTLYTDTYCSETPCSGDQCPGTATEYEASPDTFDFGTSGHNEGGDGTSLSTNYAMCILERSCNSGCSIYSGVNSCQNGDVDLFEDENAKYAAKKWSEIETGFCGYF